MPFDAAVFDLVEEALSEGFKFHYSLDKFLSRSGVDAKLLRSVRAAAEDRNTQHGKFDKAPKRFVVQELLSQTSQLDDKGDRVLASIITGLVNINLPDASDEAVTAIDRLKERMASDKRAVREKQAEQEKNRALAARGAERLRETKRAERQAEKDRLKDRFIELMGQSNAQKRGYLLESFLNDFFDHEGLEPRKSFKIVGEQIDGSFMWRERASLVEAKWVGEPVAGAQFGAFAYKIEGKSADTRGLFISINGYSTEAIRGMNAKGSLKFVCLDGAHLMQALSNYDGLRPILERVWRHADETGESYLPVADF
ncbi:hypothetical protein [Novosphingopyxis sp. YJ-S2-01]|uniref:hypothetical protein n=1 Tax=Novosphingopyxis sp. YJ-S2-01 TaxID=2794021 RepID=UPI0018DAF976|nr:hypothetical protein [Novosphingopyxis sp. YJ-S2-01]MBH9536451.1 hypothetical protein [Novosphingopyxis sp. YJ-S2-01]